MRARLLRIGLLSLVLVAVLTIAGRPKPSVEPTYTCTGSGPKKVLIIGHSWATHPEIGEGLAASTALRVCQIGFPGLTSPAIAQKIRTNSTPYRAFDFFILMTGLNDAAGHHGVNDYVTSTSALISEFKTSGVVYVVEIPPFDPGYAGPLHTGFYRLRSIAWDGGEWNSLDLYRSSMRTKIDGARLIRLDPFIPSYRGHEGDYVDGIHLRPARFRDFGTYLGRAIASRAE